MLSTNIMGLIGLTSSRTDSTFLCSLPSARAPAARYSLNSGSTMSDEESGISISPGLWSSASRSGRRRTAEYPHATEARNARIEYCSLEVSGASGVHIAMIVPDNDWETARHLRALNITCAVIVVGTTSIFVGWSSTMVANASRCCPICLSACFSFQGPSVRDVAYSTQRVLHGTQARTSMQHSHVERPRPSPPSPLSYLQGSHNPNTQ